MRTFGLLMMATLLAFLATAAMLLSTETVEVQSYVKATASTHTPQGELRTRAHVSYGSHHAASLADDDDVDDDGGGDDFDASNVDEDVEHPIAVTSGARPPASHTFTFPDPCPLRPARGHVSLPEHPPRIAAS